MANFQVLCFVLPRTIGMIRRSFTFETVECVRIRRDPSNPVRIIYMYGLPESIEMSNSPCGWRNRLYLYPWISARYANLELPHACFIFSEVTRHRTKGFSFKAVQEEYIVYPVSMTVVHQLAQLYLDSTRFH
jgi:hypothetical protein